MDGTKNKREGAVKGWRTIYYDIGNKIVAEKIDWSYTERRLILDNHN